MATKEFRKKRNFQKLSSATKQPKQQHFLGFRGAHGAGYMDLANTTQVPMGDLVSIVPRVAAFCRSHSIMAPHGFSHCHQIITKLWPKGDNLRPRFSTNQCRPQNGQILTSKAVSGCKSANLGDGTWGPSHFNSILFSVGGVYAVVSHFSMLTFSAQNGAKPRGGGGDDPSALDANYPSN